MQINYRSFPHPVLSHFDDDILHCAFQTNLKVSATKSSYILNIKNALSNKDLKELIESEQAKVVHIPG